MNVLLRASLLCLASLAPPSSAPSQVSIVAFEEPTPAVVRALAACPDFDVRWVERGLIVAEVPDAVPLPAGWGGRVLGRRLPEQGLALLRACDRERLQDDPGASWVLTRLRASRMATAHAQAGESWILVGAPGAWPREVLGCHGGLLLPQHGLDPRSLLEAGPPAPLRPQGRTRVRKLRQAEKALLASVSPDSISQTITALSLDSFGRPAERHVFGTDLDSLYSPRVEAAMQRAIEGIPAASVRRAPFAKSRSCGGRVVVDSTYNVIARLPGTVPGTGVFVVCAHIDATGSRNAAWSAARDACEPLVATPGTEDNATGVAAVLEMLRCTADGVRSGSLDFAFDLDFIAFSGEEAEGREGGLTGSHDYVESQLEAGRKLLGAFNLDMVGSDSLGNRRLQVVHNVASRWLAEWLVEAAAMAAPPIDLDPVMELDESLASDHNSFWNVNVPAILGADAPIDVLRRYASYHRPTDLGADVSLAKTTEVTRAFLAALLQFNRLDQTESILVFPGGLQLAITLQGSDLPYEPESFRVWPGSPLKATLSLYNVGAPYAAPMRVQMWLRCPPALEPTPMDRRIFDCRDDSCFSRGGGTMPLQTGDRLDFRVEPIPLLTGDRGACEVVAQVIYEQGGSDSVRVFATPFVVAEQTGLPLKLTPNPLRDPETARLDVSVERPGSLHLQLYNTAGRRVATQVTAVQPHYLQASGSLVNVPLHLESAGQAVPSGIYYLLVEWVGAGGERQSSVARLVLVR